MAIDTAAKRRSAAGIPGIPLGVGVTPDTDKDQFWRQCAGWGYGGILAGAPSEGIVHSLPVVWEFTHELAVAWEFTHTLPVVWEFTHEMAVKWED